MRITKRTTQGYSISKEVLRSILKCDMVLVTFDATPKVPQHTGLTGGEHRGSRHHLICAPSPLLIETGGSIPLLCLQGVPTFLAHLRLRPVSLGNSRRSLVGGATCGKTPISRSALNKRRSNQSILKEINPEYSLEGLMQKLNLHYLST